MFEYYYIILYLSRGTFRMYTSLIRTYRNGDFDYVNDELREMYTTLNPFTSSNQILSTITLSI